jgi:ankyrin repeat protein
MTHGADVNGVDKYGKTPLHKACERNQNSIAQMLINQGAANFY